MTSAARLITNSGGIISSGGIIASEGIIPSEGQNFDNIDTTGIENDQSVIDSESNNSPTFLDKITIKYYGTIPPLIITKDHQVTNVADILKLSRHHLQSIFSTMFPGDQGLYFVTAPLFGLIDEKHKYWLVSTDTLTSKAPTYYYRFQYCLSLESNSCHKLFREDKFFCVYFFTQCRDDFINNRIPTLYTEEKQGEMLGFVSVDYQIPKSSYNYKHVTKQKSEVPTTHNPLQSYKFLSQWKHVPKKCRKEFYSPISYFFLYKTIRDELRSKGQISTDNVRTLQREYVLGIFQGASEYCIENYSGIPLNISNKEQNSMNIKIQPYKEPSGVYYDEELAFAITDILDIEHEKYSINGVKFIRVVIVFSPQECATQVIKFDYLNGLSFVYKLLGYYKLMVNYHMHIKDLDSSTSSQSLDLKDLHCFGPMTASNVMQIMSGKLKDFQKTNMGITSVYLIAQDMVEDKLVFYSCNLYNENQSYPMKVGNGCYYVIKTDETKEFKNKAELFKYLGKTFGRQIKPDIYNGNVWIKKIFSGDNQRTNDRSEIARNNDSGPQFFSSDHFTIIDPNAEKEGDLCVDIIKVRQSANRETVMSMIQLKSAIPLPQKPATDDLVELCDTLHKIKSSTFIRFFGVSTDLPYRLFVDCSPHGSLFSMIRNTFRNPNEPITSQTDMSGMEEITLLQFVTTVTTVCKGLEYLWKNNLHHGNIKCSNVFVYGLTNVQFDVKIGHPGLVKFYNKQPLTDVINIERIPWIGVELFDNLSSCSIESEIYSFSTFIWEFLSYGKNPVDELNGLNLKKAEERKTFFKDGRKMRKPLTLEHDDLEFPFKKTIKDQMWELMSECWSAKPEDRPDVTDIIKRLKSMYSLYGEVTELEINIESLKQIDRPQNSQCNVIRIEKLKLGREIGKGHYGMVKYAKYYPDLSKEDFQEVAVKLTLDSSTDTPQIRERKKKLFEEEIKAMEKAQHKNVIKIIGVCYKGESQTVVMELVKNGDLAKWLKKHKKEELIDPYHNVYRKFVEEIAEGMSYLSSKGIIHRDLAARNILITEDEHIKISDFGLAKCLEEKHYYLTKSLTDLPHYWTAPECFGSGKKVTFAADVWSFGVVLWEIYSGGKNPVLDKDKHLHLLRSGQRLEITSDWPICIKNFMEKCWKISPEERPSFAVIVQELNETAI